jgi:hypothetical protein
LEVEGRLRLGGELREEREGDGRGGEKRWKERERMSCGSCKGGRRERERGKEERKVIWREGEIMRERTCL